MKHLNLFTTLLLISGIGLANAADDFYDNSIKYYDNLKTCSQHTFSYPHPFDPGFIGKNIINGKKGDKCSVTMLMPGNMKMECEFTPETISLMTSDEKYKEAREKKMSGSSSDPASKKMQEECKI